MILVVQNDPDAPPGILGEVLERRSDEHRILPAYPTALPDRAPERGLVLLGGEMGAYETADHPFLVDELRLVRDAVERHVPVLGLCLGAQLIAAALGGRAYRAPAPEVVVEAIDLTAAGAAHPVVGAFDGVPLLRFHQDTFELPDGATVLGTGGGFVQAFALGSALALQPHPEVTTEILRGWVASASPILERAGTHPDALLSDFAAVEEAVVAAASRAFTAWPGR